jgi:hypothetical protein|tara:strand:- start:3630 stop:3908 length:279 start_codon:yes stop_codon:yes gene_type:complete
MNEFDSLGLGPYPNVPFGFAPDQAVMLAIASIKQQVYEEHPDWFYKDHGMVAVRAECHRKVIAATLQVVANQAVQAPVDATIEITNAPIWYN